MFLKRRSEDRAGIMRAAGFTIIEIVIAMTIIGILSTLGFMGIRGYIAKAKRLKTETSLTQTKSLIQEYNDHTGAYPATLRDLVNRPTDQKVSMRWRGPYAVEEDFIKGSFIDGWYHELQYQPTPGSQYPFSLYSWGPKGESAPQEEWIDAWSI